MKWLKNIQNMFKQAPVEEQSATPTPSADPIPVEWPDEITIEWPECAWHLNLRMEHKTLKGDMGKWLFEQKQQERAYWKALEKYEERVGDQVEELRKKKNIPDNYNFVGPGSTGESGKFKKS